MNIFSSFTNFIKVSLLLLLLTISSGWVGDYIKDNIEGFLKSEPVNAANLLKALVSTCLFILVAYVVYKNKSKIIDIPHLKKPGEPAPHKALILFLSSFNATLKEENNQKFVEVKNNKNESVILIGQLEKDLAEIKKIKVPLEMGLMAYNHHKAELTHLALIASQGSRGSDSLLEVYEFLFKKYTPNIKISSSIHNSEKDLSIDFDNFEEAQSAIERALTIFRKENLANKDIIIDITSGPKTTSIAGAIASLRHPNLEFQYVNTNDASKITSFDMVSQSMPEGIN